MEDSTVLNSQLSSHLHEKALFDVLGMFFSMVVSFSEEHRSVYVSSLNHRIMQTLKLILVYILIL